MRFPKLLAVASFTFVGYQINTDASIVTFTYRVKFVNGLSKICRDKLSLHQVKTENWVNTPEPIITATLDALLIMIGINYWSLFPTKNIFIEKFSLTRSQAEFWNTVYTKGLAEYFYQTKTDFRNLISFPFEDNIPLPIPTPYKSPKRSLLLNGAGKDSILSAEILKQTNTIFDYFTVGPVTAHKRVAETVGVKTISASRHLDPILKPFIPGSYPSVSTYTFIATLLAELLGYNEIIFSNEKSADFGNVDYLGLHVNHQWCKSTEAEKLINGYIQSYITPDISTKSLLREYSEIEIVRRFVQYPQYLYNVTSCNTYFWLPTIQQKLTRPNYWCGRCAKCVFLFACFSAYLPRKVVVDIFRSDLYEKKRLLPLYREILGIEGFKPFDCVGEPGEMILAMHYAANKKDYAESMAIKLFKQHFPSTYDFKKLEKDLLSLTNV
jgi:hypothetical protein